MHKQKLNLSIVIPTYNEESLLESVVKKTLEDAEAIAIIKQYEIIVVDDGSSDNTGVIAKNIAKKYKQIRIISYQNNRGLGGALFSGIKVAQYDFVTFIPADGQLYLRDFESSLEKILEADIVLTYRTNRDDYTLYRHFLSTTLRLCMFYFFGLKFRDYNWAHIWRKNIFDKFQPRSAGVFFLAEIAVRGKHAGCRIVEGKSVYRSRLAGKSRNKRFSVAVQTMRDLLRTWLEMRTI